MMASTKTIVRIAYIGMAALLAAATSPTAAQDVQVQSVVATDGKVACLQMKTGATHPCEGFTPPPKVAVGETFGADGKSRKFLGSHMVGHAAEELINIFGLAKKHGITATQLRDFIYAYPSFSSDIKHMV